MTGFEFRPRSPLIWDVLVASGCDGASERWISCARLSVVRSVTSQRYWRLDGCSPAPRGLCEEWTARATDFNRVDAVPSRVQRLAVARLAVRALAELRKGAA